MAVLVRAVLGGRDDAGLATDGARGNARRQPAVRPPDSAPTEPVPRTVNAPDGARRSARL